MIKEIKEKLKVKESKKNEDMKARKKLKEK